MLYQTLDHQLLGGKARHSQNPAKVLIHIPISIIHSVNYSASGVTEYLKLSLVLHVKCTGYGEEDYTYIDQTMKR